jgi:hypothetical protein
MEVTPLPNAVTPGNSAGFEVTVTNNGPSQIAALYLNDNKGETPAYLASPDVVGACGPTDPPSGPLFCSFGALVAGDSVTIIVAYTTPTSGSSYAITFQANTTGATFSDGKGRSHGDTLTLPVSTALSNNKNFAGVFSTADGTGVANNANLTGNNKQATELQGLPAGVPATVFDGPTATGSCTPEPGINCALLEGEWSEVNVAGGDATDGFFIIMKFKNVNEPSMIFHSFGPPADQERIDPCADPENPVAPCFVWDDVAETATIFTLHNGSYIRGK